jgi:hypothetical protein
MEAIFCNSTFMTPPIATTQLQHNLIQRRQTVKQKNKYFSAIALLQCNISGLEDLQVFFVFFGFISVGGVLGLRQAIVNG